MNQIQIFSRDKGFKQFELLKPKELLNFEQNLAAEISLPEGFKSFLIKYNGGVFHESLFIDGPVGPVVVAAFMPISDEQPNSINKAYSFFKTEVGDGFIPFGADPGGNYFLIGSRAENLNKVYFWDHERQTTYELSESFEKFMNALVIDN